MSDDVILPKFKLNVLRDSTIEIVNFEELTGHRQSEYDVNGTNASDKFTFVNPGVAEVRVNLSGVYMGTVYITVLPASENAAVTDVTYMTVPAAAEGGTATVTMGGNLRFDLKAALPDDQKLTKVSFAITMNRNDTTIYPDSDNFTIGGVKYQRNGTFLYLPAGETSVCLPFSMTGLPEGTNNLIVTITIKYSINDANVLNLTDAACFTGLRYPNYLWTRVRKGQKVGDRCLEFRTLGTSEKHTILWDAGTKSYVFREATTDLAAEVAVGVYDAEGALIADGINADTGVIAQNGTLRVSVTYGGATYTIEKTV